MEQFLILLSVLGVIILIYVGTMYLNDKTEIPEECREAYLEAQGCKSCSAFRKDSSSCGFKDVLKIMEDKQ